MNNFTLNERDGGGKSDQFLAGRKNEAHVRASDFPPARRAPLSKAHIGSQELPRVEFYGGASLLRVDRGGPKREQVGGGHRGRIDGFSFQSRRRLLQKIGQVRRDAALPMFSTLTYHDIFPSARASKRDLKNFNLRMVRAFPGAGGFWKLEPQERGAPHFHSLTWGVEWHELFSFTVKAWHEIAGYESDDHFKFLKGVLTGSVPCVSQVRSWWGVWAYAAKYLGKTFEVAGWENTGRFWGVIQPANIPFGELGTVDLTRQMAIDLMRYGRRFSGMKARGANRSMHLFCDADQWVEKLVLPDLQKIATGEAETFSAEPVAREI